MNHKRGLLCQAKICGRHSRWGVIKSNQKQLLQNNLNHLALLLYCYTDQKGERRELAPFAWQLAAGSTVESLSQWLAAGQFPDLKNSKQILKALAHDLIGTDNKEVIESVITPPLRAWLVIKIGWKNGDDPAAW